MAHTSLKPALFLLLVEPKQNLEDLDINQQSELRNNTEGHSREASLLTMPQALPPETSPEALQDSPKHLGSPSPVRSGYAGTDRGEAQIM